MASEIVDSSGSDGGRCLLDRKPFARINNTQLYDPRTIAAVRTI